MLPQQHTNLNICCVFNATPSSEREEEEEEEGGGRHLEAESHAS